MPDAIGASVPATGGRPITAYRLYLCDRVGMIATAETLDAASDAEADAIAAATVGACRCYFPFYELWQGDRLVVPCRAAPCFDAATLSARRQDSVLALELTLQDSHDALRRSARLLDAMAALTVRASDAGG